MRPPAVPLVTHDPYFSVWSFSDRLADDWSQHWTGKVQAMCGLCRIDGTPFRFAGAQPKEVSGNSVAAMKQTALEVWPTQTIYRFEAGGVELELSFLSPVLASEIELVARPVTYVALTVRSLDENPHDVSLYFDVSAEWVVNTPDQRVDAARYRLDGLSVLRCGSAEQRILNRAGDDLRIDWGHLYVASPTEAASSMAIGGHGETRSAFASSGALPSSDDLRFPRAANDDWPVLATAFALGDVAKEPVARHLLIAYDDLFCIEFLQRRLRPYWRRAGMEVAGLLALSESSYADLLKRCREFDKQLVADLERVGGPEYAYIATLAYRQTLAAHKVAADIDGSPLMFAKENFSNGCIATVDVIYPAAPFFLLNPRMLAAQLTPVLEYARSSRWPHPFAPHDLGTYPLANGQVYGGGERSLEDQMPVEESANMLILLAALAQAQGNSRFADRYAAQTKKWADYLDDHGFDPAHQLCTDDFAGPLAHNTNLSLKATVALAAYARLREMAGKADDAKTYRAVAEDFARRWVEQASDGDHYRLAFDKPGTWSQKYNLIWDRVLDLKLFPPQVAATEIAYYKTKLNRYGLPLDNRKDYTKLDWCVWSAALASDPADFRAIVRPLRDFANETPDRVPMTDWFSTVTARKSGFQARSVVGGVYMPLLCDRELWKKRVKQAR